MYPTFPVADSRGGFPSQTKKIQNTLIEQSVKYCNRTVTTLNTTDYIENPRKQYYLHKTTLHQIFILETYEITLASTSPRSLISWCTPPFPTPSQTLVPTVHPKYKIWSWGQLNSVVYVDCLAIIW